MSVKSSEIAPTPGKAFTANAYYERLIRLRAEQPEVFAILSPAEKITLGYYEAEKHRRALLDQETLTPA
jgi:hypothetical protein